MLNSKMSVSAIGALTAAASVLSISGTALANRGSCQVNRITNIHWACVSPGANCGGSCVCRDVAGSIWRDCYCLKANVRRGGSNCDSGGTWRVLPTGPLAQNTQVGFQTIQAPTNIIEVFDPIDVDAAGNVIASQPIFDPEFFGQFDMVILNGPPNAVPVEMVFLDLVSVAPIDIMGIPMGVNQVILDPLAVQPQGVFNSITGVISFDEPLECILFNDVFPQGIDLIAYPAFAPSPAQPGAFDLRAKSVTFLEFEAPLPSFCPGDADGNRVVNFNDITTVLGFWLSNCPLP